MDLHHIPEQLLRRRILEIDMAFGVQTLLDRRRHVEFGHEVAEPQVNRLVTGQFQRDKGRNGTVASFLLRAWWLPALRQGRFEVTGYWRVTSNHTKEAGHRAPSVSPRYSRHRRWQMRRPPDGPSKVTEFLAGCGLRGPPLNGRGFGDFAIGLFSQRLRMSVVGQLRSWLE